MGTILGPDLCDIQTIKDHQNQARKEECSYMSKNKLTQGGPHGGLGEEVPMNTRYTNTSTEENFHISENWKMKDHYRETMQARDAEKRNWRKDMT